MILKRLVEYYDRRAAGDQPLAQIGLERKPIAYTLVLAEDGELLTIRPNFRVEGKKKVCDERLVPKAVKRSSGIAANLLWDKPDYLLGLVPEKARPERVVEQFKAFVGRIKALPETVRADAGIAAVLAFYEHFDPDELAARHPQFIAECRSGAPLLTFSLQGDAGIWVCQRPAVLAEWQAQQSTAEAADGVCLVTGEPATVARLHPAIRSSAVWGAQTAGGNIVSFNFDAACSFGKSQGANAPIGELAAEKYTTALNDGLLARDSRQRFQVGDASVAAWAEQVDELETGLVDLFGEPLKDDPDYDAGRVGRLYESIKSGKYREQRAADGDRRFHVLGLAPNAARISVRFWHVATLAELATNIGQHFRDIDIVHAEFEPDRLSLWRMLVSVAVLGKSENIPPRLGGEWLMAILRSPDAPYPAGLLQGVVRRIRAEQSKRNDQNKSVQNVTYPRAALLKGCLNRLIRNGRSGKALTVALDSENKDKAYRLGRLFAVYERLQEEAGVGGETINSTIRDKYYGAASANPRSVFPILDRMCGHHLKKLAQVRAQRAAYFHRLIGEIIWELDPGTAFSGQMSFEDQGRFAIGYYHQRQSFFQKKDAAATEQEA